jgi:hypothetical protein
MGCAASSSSVNISAEPVAMKTSVSRSISPIVPPTDPPRPEGPHRQVDNVENSVVVWLDASIGDNSNTQKSKDQIRQLVNIVKIYTDPEECHTFINGLKGEKIFLIVSGTLGEQFIGAVQEVTQIDSVYVFCSNKEKHEHWANKIVSRGWDKN